MKEAAMVDTQYYVCSKSILMTTERLGEGQQKQTVKTKQRYIKGFAG
jgi:hypothetical protein